MGTVNCDRPPSESRGSDKRGFRSSGLKAGSSALFGRAHATPRSDYEYRKIQNPTLEHIPDQEQFSGLKLYRGDMAAWID